MLLGGEKFPGPSDKLIARVDAGRSTLPRCCCDSAIFEQDIVTEEISRSSESEDEQEDEIGLKVVSEQLTNLFSTANDWFSTAVVSRFK